jgi:hypothetical protein
MVRNAHLRNLIQSVGPQSFVAAALLLSPLLSHAQIVSASLYGTVTDPTSAAVPSATIVATNVATGIGNGTTTDAAEDYTLPSLPPATYDIKIEKAGFRTTVISGVTLLVDQKARVDVQLNVGQISTSVEVTLVETKTASVGTVVGSQQVGDLPLNLRRITTLATLVPGTVDNRGQGYGANVVRGSPFSEATYSAGGGRDASNTLFD